MLALTKAQLPVIKEIQSYLIDNLGFDKYSKFKLQNSSAINIVENKDRNNAKSLIRLTILNTNILNNYFIPSTRSVRRLVGGCVLCRPPTDLAPEKKIYDFIAKHVAALFFVRRLRAVFTFVSY
jgi:hypothetical protein